MTGLFFYGTLCHAPLLRVVLGRDAAAIPARLSGHSVYWVEGAAFPIIREGGSAAEGVFLPEPSAKDLERLDFYEGGFAYATRELEVMTESGPALAKVYFPQDDRWLAGAPWNLADWVARWGDVATATAGDFMRQMGIVPAEKLHRRYPMMLMRGGARVRAEATRGAASMRRDAGDGDVAETRVAQVYANYFAVEEYDLRFRRFDGALSPEVNRAVFVGGDAAVVLPYDPVRDRVLLIEQFRMGPHARGERQAWLLEAVAGRIDGGETPQEAALREAREEAGLELSALVEAYDYYPSPAAMGEYLYTFIGIADLPDGAAGHGGLATEAEDIRAHLLSVEAFMALVRRGEVNAAPLLLLALFLEREREGLRRRYGA